MHDGRSDVAARPRSLPSASVQWYTLRAKRPRDEVPEPAHVVERAQPAASEDQPPKRAGRASTGGARDGLREVRQHQQGRRGLLHSLRSGGEQAGDGGARKSARAARHSARGRGSAAATAGSGDAAAAISHRRFPATAAAQSSLSAPAAGHTGSAAATSRDVGRACR
jgi:hypothetical protein